MSDAVRIERQGARLVAVIDHPPANAISGAVVAGLRDAIARAAADDAVRVLVITGAGERFFAAGADISEFPTDGSRAGASGGQQLTAELEALPKITLAAVNGMALGGGCEIAMACDLRVAAPQARFGQPEINLGIIPGWGGTQRLPRLIGRGPAMPLLLTGDPIDAPTALRLGLVSKLIEGDFTAGVAEYADMLAGKAPLAVAATKRAINEGLDGPLAEGLAAEQRAFSGLFATEDAREGITAFLEKRRPTWKGR
jgi:enoyl-CoA hydratase